MSCLVETIHFVQATHFFCKTIISESMTPNCVVLTCCPYSHFRITTADLSFSAMMTRLTEHFGIMYFLRKFQKLISSLFYWSIFVGDMIPTMSTSAFWTHHPGNPRKLRVETNTVGWKREVFKLIASFKSERNFIVWDAISQAL